MSAPQLVIGIDIGERNFGLAALRFTPSATSRATTTIKWEWDVVLLRLWDLQAETTAHTSFATARRLWALLDTIAWLWTCEQSSRPIVLVEQQMQSRHACNVRALKLAQHAVAYFLLRFPRDVDVLEMPAKHKTRAFGETFRLKRDRKAWTVAETIRRLTAQDDVVALHWLSTLPKRDDVSDCIMMALAFWRMQNRSLT